MLWLVYPAVFRNPVTGLLEAAESSSAFRGSHGDWRYVPVHVLVDLPVLTSTLAFVGVVASVIFVFRQGRSWGPR